MTNAGSTGLNLQAANTVINVDLPWNPAVLEQRIARAHRMGQKQPVQVYLLVTEDTIEERLLGTLSAKHDLALAALDVESDVSEVELQSGMEELKRRLERLLGKKPAAPIDVSQQRAVEAETREIAARRSRPPAASCWAPPSTWSASWSTAAATRPASRVSSPPQSGRVCHTRRRRPGSIAPDVSGRRISQPPGNLPGPAPGNAATVEREP